MEKYHLTFSKQAQKDLKLLAAENLSEKARALLEILEIDPFQDPPPYEKLRGEASGKFSRRINSKHRLVYDVRECDGRGHKGVVHIIRMRTHYRGMYSVLFL
ncbi:MAG: Txe/YoeB family addiction module toxin [Methanomassiliicoccaceae archaeon]|nr:Txe/YoeB family addiction module toxin [Methanomassiliicoccaceae archaeon]